MIFAEAGIEVSPLWPALTAFITSCFCSTAGISGAFLLLPYQISILGYAAPGASATNQIFNILACPAGVWKYAGEGRLLLSLALVITAGSIPGAFLGAIVRIRWLSSLSQFMGFVAIMLLYLAFRLFKTSIAKGSPKFSRNDKCVLLSKSWLEFTFNFGGTKYAGHNPGIFFLSFLVGMAGGIYGVGGGAIIAPFLIAIYKFPVHAIAGATLFSTFLTSFAGVFFYSILGHLLNVPAAAPDWGLGLCLGAGGIGGMYAGSAMQKYLPARFIRIFLTLLLSGLGFFYLWKFFSLNGCL